MSVTYPSVARLSTLDTDDLGDGLVINSSVINEFFLHHGGIFEVSWLVTSLVESVSLGGKRCHTVCLAELNL